MTQTWSQVNDYWDKCTQILSEVLQRPSMYYNSVQEYNALFLGHEAAFRQLFELDPSELFTSTFKRWLNVTKKIAGSTDWTELIEEYANNNELTPFDCFLSMIQEFMVDQPWSKKTG